MALALYVLGLLAVNGYLFTLGVSDFALVRVRFIYTGALIVGLTTLSALIPAAVVFAASIFYRESHSSWRHKKLRTFLLWLPIVIIILMGFTLAPMILLQIFRQFEGLSGEDSIASLLIGGNLLTSAEFELGVQLYVYALSIILVNAGLGHYVYVLSRRRSIPILARLTMASLVLAFLSYMSVFYLSFFMTEVYPKVPVQFGGGRATEVRLLVKSDAIVGAKSLGIPFPPNGELSSPVQLAYEGNDGYVVRLPGDVIVQLGREMVSGVRSRS